MIVHLIFLNFLLLIFCTKTTQAETMYETEEVLRSRNIEPTRIRKDFHSKCIIEPPSPTTTQKPTMTNCNNSLPLETTTQKLDMDIPEYRPKNTYSQRKTSPFQETLEDINLYCQLLERAFKLTETPPSIIPKYNNAQKLHFIDSPLLKPKPKPASDIVTKPCKNNLPIRSESRSPIINTPIHPCCIHKQEQISKMNNFNNWLSFLSSPLIKPALKHDCPHHQNSNLYHHPIKEREASNIPLQSDMYNPISSVANSRVMQYLNLLPNRLEYPLPISRNRRNIIHFRNGQQDLNFADEVSERLPIEENGINDRIIGGTIAHSKEVPYQVAVYKLDYFICGSSLISKFYILTAGHCLDNIKVTDLWIRVGSEYLLNGGETYKVRDYTVHPDYKTTDFDIAIIRSANAIKFGPGVQPIALPSFADADLPENIEVTGSGWGATERKSAKESTYTLHKIILLIVDRESCRDRIMASRNKIGRRQICTNLPLKAGMCFGDSGGPLVANNKLIGIVSWGSPCAIGDADVYTNVKEFLPWIFCEMKKLDYKYSNDEY